jgi:hypothetical protein
MMRQLYRASAACAFIACVSGCAAPGGPLTTVTAPNARDAIIIGKSTKADVMAALGKTTAIRFDSGYEVWVYRVTGGISASLGGGGPFRRADSDKRALDRTEFVVLFAPSGVVAKTRIRPPPPPAEARGT